MVGVDNNMIGPYHIIEDDADLVQEMRMEMQPAAAADIEKKILKRLRNQYLQENQLNMSEISWGDEDNGFPAHEGGANPADEDDNGTKGIVLYLSPINRDLSFKEEPKEEWGYYEDEKLKRDKMSKNKPDIIASQ